MTATHAGTTALSRPIVLQGIRDSFAKLDPRVQVRNPVMFVVFVGSLFTTALGVAAALGMAPDAGRPGFVLHVAAWLWLTVLFANFAEAVAEGRGKAQAAALRSHAQGSAGEEAQGPAPRRTATRSSRRPRCGATTSCWSRPGTSFPRTARSSTASPRWTKARSPANRRPCCASRAATSARSPAARACCRTGSWCASPAIRARRSSTA